MDIKKKNIGHYSYLLILLFLDVWLTKIVALNYNSESLDISFIVFFTLLNILFGIKEVSILDNGLEKKYRFNFIINIVTLLLCGPCVAFVSLLAAALVYIPFNQFRRFRKVDLTSVILHMLSLTISINIMSLIFFQFNGQVFEPNFPNNIFAILFGAVSNFTINVIVIALWIKLYDFQINLVRLIRKEFLWLLRYDLWQAIYALLITNTIRLYFGDMLNFQNSSDFQNDQYIVFIGIIIVAAILYYPIIERLEAFNLLIQFNRQNNDLTLLSQKHKENNKRIIRAFILMLEKRDPYTCGHSERVALYSKIIAKKLGMDESACEMLETAALLHDIGKVGIDIGIINKSDVLTEEEFEEIKKHPEYGAEIIGRMYNGNKKSDDDEFELVLDITCSHHERFDGRGYPRGIAGDDITLEARIIAVADALDAMTSDRPYRAGMPLEQAIEEIKRNCKTQFCPKIVSVFLECVEDGSLTLYNNKSILDQLSVFS